MKAKVFAAILFLFGALAGCTTVTLERCTIHLSGERSQLRLDASKDVSAGNPTIPDSTITDVAKAALVGGL